MILEQKDVESIVNLVVEQLKPLLQTRQQNKEEEKILDVKTLGEYLMVDQSWIYKKVQYGEIPYFKVGKYNRFKKSDIDKWIQSQTIRPVPTLKPAFSS